MDRVHLGNAVRAVREKFEEYGLDVRAFADIKVAAVGEQTAAALREFGIMPDVVPGRKQFAERLADFWPAFYEVLEPINGVLLPRAVIATETLVAGLTDLGWEAEDVTALVGGKSAGISRAVQHLVASPASLRGPGSAGQWDQPSGPRRRSVP